MDRTIGQNGETNMPINNNLTLSNIVTGTLSTTGNIISVDCSNWASVKLMAVGNLSGDCIFEESPDGGTTWWPIVGLLEYCPTTGAENDGSLWIDTNNGTDNQGSWRFDINNTQLFRIRAESVISGSLTITMILSSESSIIMGALARIGVVGQVRIHDGNDNLINLGQNTMTNSLPIVVASDQSEIPINNAQVNGNAVVTSVPGIQDVMPRKRTSSTGLSPNYSANHITSKTTTVVTAATAYITTVVISCSGAGTAWSLVIQNKEGTPKILVPNFTLTVPVAGLPVILQFEEPILMTGGIDIITAGTTAGTVDVFVTYWQ